MAKTTNTDKRIAKYIRLAGQFGQDYTELDVDGIEGRLNSFSSDSEWLELAKSSHRHLLIYSDIDEVYELPKEFIANAPTDIAALLAAYKQQTVLIAMLLDDNDTLRARIQTFLDGLDQGVKDGSVVYTDEEATS